MKRKLAVAVLGISSLAIPQFAGAGQAGNYGGYNQNTYYNDGRYGRTAPYDRGWHDRGDYRDNYYHGGYDDRPYGDRDHHAGRSVAIIGGSAAAGAAIGAAAGHGQGAAIGAIVGGVAGVAADQAVRHHDHDRRW